MASSHLGPGVVTQEHLAEVPAPVKAPVVTAARTATPLRAFPRLWFAVAEVVVRLGLMALVPVLLPRVFDGDPRHYRVVARRIHVLRPPAWQWMPYRKVFWEYPPLSVPILALEKLSGGSLTVYRLMVGAVMVICEFGCLHLLRRGWPERAKSLTVIWTVTVLPIAALTWFRMDFFVTLVATAALVAIVRRGKGGGGWLATGFAAKLWPIGLGGLLLVRRRWRDLAVTVLGSAAVMVAWYAWSAEGVRAFFRFRSSRSLELESLFGGFGLFPKHAQIRLDSGTWVLWHAGGTWAQPVLYLMLAVVSLGCLWRARGADSDLVALAGALTMAGTLFSWILSPQYIVWTAPMVALVAAFGSRRVAYWYGAASILTFFYLIAFDPWYAIRRGTHTGWFAASLIVVRNGLLLGVLVELVLAIKPRHHQRVPAADPADSVGRSAVG
ncbi:MAG: hypothetical protein JWN46_2065 [Acidimicrobiales bacterium]|nr:hypothetical protein [Acidimicrobiales bacterium]